MVRTHKRSAYEVLVKRLQEPRRFIQVIAGPRQVGKTTLVQQALDALPWPAHYISADQPSLHGLAWIEAQWQQARLLAKQSGKTCLLALDEVQKIPNWSEAVKRLWDEDTHQKLPIKVIILGSSALLLQRGLTESLAGRFEKIIVGHWSYSEMKKAFLWDVDQFIYYGGYPGAVPLIKEPARWAAYIRDSLIETTLSRDILLITRVDKPALLRRLFELGCRYSGQILSYQKMLGQLQETGNAQTMAHYLELLATAGLLTGIEKYAGQAVRQKASSPKLQALNTALISAQQEINFITAKQTKSYWGRLFESAVGAHLANEINTLGGKLFYWRDRNKEVDFIVQYKNKLLAIEVKSGAQKENFSGLNEFTEKFSAHKILIVGEQGIPIETFLQTSITDLI